MMCRVLKVSRSGFYAWRQRPESKQAKSRRRLIGIIKEIHEESKRSYGSPRVHWELIARGEICCENTVARYMRENDIVAKTKRKFKHTTDSNHSLPVAKNLLDRDSDHLEPNLIHHSDRGSQYASDDF